MVRDDPLDRPGLQDEHVVDVVADHRQQRLEAVVPRVGGHDRRAHDPGGRIAEVAAGGDDLVADVAVGDDPGGGPGGVDQDERADPVAAHQLRSRLDRQPERRRDHRAGRQLAHRRREQQALAAAGQHAARAHLVDRLVEVLGQEGAVQVLADQGVGVEEPAEVGLADEVADRVARRDDVRARAVPRVERDEADDVALGAVVDEGLLALGRAHEDLGAALLDHEQVLARRAVLLEDHRAVRVVLQRDRAGQLAQRRLLEELEGRDLLEENDRILDGGLLDPRTLLHRAAPRLVTGKP